MCWILCVFKPSYQAFNYTIGFTDGTFGPKHPSLVPTLIVVLEKKLVTWRGQLYVWMVIIQQKVYLDPGKNICAYLEINPSQISGIIKSHKYSST